MAITRRLASRLLGGMVRGCRAESREWSTAMQRELDLIESDWAALCWAIGGATAVCRHSLVHELRDWREAGRGAGWSASVLFGGAIAAVVLGVSIAALVGVMRASWFEPAQGALAEPLFIVVIPETCYLLGAIALWRLHKRVACGILAAGFVLFTHAVVHFIT